MSRTVLPDEAVTWLSVWQGVQGLVLGGDAHLTRRLAQLGHTVCVLTDDPGQAARVGSLDRVTSMVARAEAIPTDPFSFEVVYCHQGLHRLDLAQALPQISRVLRPGGCLSASYLIRDDSVPWVRRLTALLRRYDPMAMRGDYGHDSLARLRDSKYFPEIEERAFRIWQRISREDLIGLVRAQPLTAGLDEEQLSGLLAQVGSLYDAAVRPGEALRLPFQLLCQRAWIDHEELTGPVALPDDALAIPL